MDKNILKAIRRYFEKFIPVKDIAENVGISLSASYKIHRKLSAQWSDKQILSGQIGRPKRTNSIAKSRICKMLLKVLLVSILPYLYVCYRTHLILKKRFLQSYL